MSNAADPYDMYGASLLSKITVFGLIVVVALGFGIAKIFCDPPDQVSGLVTCCLVIAASMIMNTGIIIAARFAAILPLYGAYELCITGSEYSYWYGYLVGFPLLAVCAAILYGALIDWKKGHISVYIWFGSVVMSLILLI